MLFLGIVLPPEVVESEGLSSASADDIMTILRRHTLTRFHVRLRGGREHCTAADARRGTVLTCITTLSASTELSAEASNGEAMPPPCQVSR